MTDVLTALILLAGLSALFAFMFRGIGGRVGRPPKGFMTRAKSPDSTPYGLAVMGAYTLGAIAALGSTAANGATGLSIGLLVAICVSVPGLRQISSVAFNLIATLLAIWMMFAFIVGNGSDSSVSIYRISLMAFISACFGGALFLSGHLTAFKDDRGLALLGLVDIVTFLAYPANRDSLSLPPTGHLTFLVIAGGMAFALGFLASEYILGVVAIAVIVVTFMSDALIGDANAAWVTLVAALAAAGFLFGFRFFIGLFRR